MRRASIVLAGVLAAVAAGCSPADERELRRALSDVAPPGTRHVKCWFSSGAWGGASPSFACVSFVPGTRNTIVLRLASRLRRAGFAVGCYGAREEIELQAVRRNRTVTATVTAEGSVVVRTDVANVFDPVYRPGGARSIPRRHVAVRLGIATHGDRRSLQEGPYRPCTSALLRSVGTSACVREWNVPSNARRRTLVAAERPRRAAWIVTPRLRDGRDSCVFMFRTARGSVSLYGGWTGGALRWSRTVHRGAWGDLGRYYRADRSNATVAGRARLTQTARQRWLAPVA